MLWKSISGATVPAKVGILRFGYDRDVLWQTIGVGTDSFNAVALGYYYLAHQSYLF